MVSSEPIPFAAFIDNLKADFSISVSLAHLFTGIIPSICRVAATLTTQESGDNNIIVCQNCACANSSQRSSKMDSVFMSVCFVLSLNSVIFSSSHDNPCPLMMWGIKTEPAIIPNAIFFIIL